MPKQKNYLLLVGKQHCPFTTKAVDGLLAKRVPFAYLPLRGNKADFWARIEAKFEVTVAKKTFPKAILLMKSARSSRASRRWLNLESGQIAAEAAQADLQCYPTTRPRTAAEAELLVRTNQPFVFCPKS